MGTKQTAMAINGAKYWVGLRAVKRSTAIWTGGGPIGGAIASARSSSSSSDALVSASAAFFRAAFTAFATRAFAVRKAVFTWFLWYSAARGTWSVSNTATA